jgi:hypothetical protein
MLVPTLAIARTSPLFTAGVLVDGTAFTMASGAGPPVESCVALADVSDSVVTAKAAATHATPTPRTFMDLPLTPKSPTRHQVRRTRRTDHHTGLARFQRNGRIAALERDRSITALPGMER